MVIAKKKIKFFKTTAFPKLMKNNTNFHFSREIKQIILHA